MKTRAIAGILITVGIGGVSVAAYNFSAETIGYRLQNTEGRVILNVAKGEPYDSAWEDLRWIFDKEYPLGYSSEDYAGGEIIFFAKELEDTCREVLIKTFRNEDDKHYKFAKKFCSVKETIKEALKDKEWDVIESSEKQKNVGYLFSISPWRDRRFENYDLWHNWNISHEKVDKFCKSRPDFFYVEGSESVELFRAICMNPRSIRDVIGSGVSYLSTDSSNDDDIWNKRFEDFKKDYGGKQPFSNTLRAIVDAGSFTFTVDKFKNVCANSLKEEVLVGTETDFVDRTRKWCTK